MRTATKTLRIGTAGWSIPAPLAGDFPGDGTVLARYATRFNAVEINTSFYRPHQPQTYARWAATTPDDFRFAVKAPRKITHEARLQDCDDALDAFIGQIEWLGDKLGPVLIQCPPSLAFNAEVCALFFDRLRDRFGRQVVCEPRHPSWFELPAEVMLQNFRIARVAADPAPCAAAAQPGGWPGLTYWRWHGSPSIYHSSYGEDRLAALSDEIAGHPAAETWCVFDNTALGAAADDALALQRMTNRAKKAATAMRPKPVPASPENASAPQPPPSAPPEPAKSGGMIGEGGRAGGGASDPAEDAREGGMIGEG